MDKTFAELQTRLAGRMSFRKFDWKDSRARRITSDFSLDTPPASVLADTDGHVVRKLQGARTSSQMLRMLKPLVQSD